MVGLGHRRCSIQRCWPSPAPSCNRRGGALSAMWVLTTLKQISSSSFQLLRLALELIDFVLPLACLVGGLRCHPHQPGSLLAQHPEDDRVVRIDDDLDCGGARVRPYKGTPP